MVIIKPSIITLGINEKGGNFGSGSLQKTINET